MATTESSGFPQKVNSANKNDLDSNVIIGNQDPEDLVVRYAKVECTESDNVNYVMLMCPDSRNVTDGYEKLMLRDDTRIEDQGEEVKNFSLGFGKCNITGNDCEKEAKWTFLPAWIDVDENTEISTGEYFEAYIDYVQAFRKSQSQLQDYLNETKKSQKASGFFIWKKSAEDKQNEIDEFENGQIERGLSSLTGLYDDNSQSDLDAMKKINDKLKSSYKGNKDAHSEIEKSLDDAQKKLDALEKTDIPKTDEKKPLILKSCLVCSAKLGIVEIKTNGQDVEKDGGIIDLIKDLYGDDTESAEKMIQNIKNGEMNAVIDQLCKDYTDIFGKYGQYSGLLYEVQMALNASSTSESQRAAHEASINSSYSEETTEDRNKRETLKKILGLIDPPPTGGISAWQFQMYGWPKERMDIEAINAMIKLNDMSTEEFSWYFSQLMHESGNGTTLREIGLEEKAYSGVGYIQLTTAGNYKLLADLLVEEGKISRDDSIYSSIIAGDTLVASKYPLEATFAWYKGAKKWLAEAESFYDYSFVVNQWSGSNPVNGYRDRYFYFVDMQDTFSINKE